jgi:hypothetical protein
MTQTTTPATPIVAETAALEPIFAALLADPLVCPRRLMDAASLLVNVERTSTTGLFLVVSASDPAVAYRVQGGLCNCPDASKRDPRRCKHALSVRCFELLERADVDADQAAMEAPIGYALTPQALTALDGPRRPTPAEAWSELYPDDAA